MLYSIYRPIVLCCHIQTDDGCYVLKVKNGRVHIFETDGELVTTMNKVTNFAKRVASGRYTSPSIYKLKEFVKVFGEYLNKGWDEYR